MQKLTLSLALILSAFVCSISNAGFVVFVDENLTYDGPGPKAIDVKIRHDGTGLSTLSGYTIRFGSPSNASAGVLPTGVTANGATAGLVIPSALFSFAPETNSVANAGLGFPGDADIGNNGVATLFTLNLNLGGAPSYTIGVDVQNAQRGGLLATEIASEFNAASPTTDFTFTLQLAAIPEPTSLALVIGSMGCALLSRRRR